MRFLPAAWHFQNPMMLNHRVSFLLVVLVGLLASPGYAQKPTSSQLPRPKLVIGIVVDQMRYDYLLRYYDRYGNGGFKRLMNEGFNSRNNYYHYGSTSTGAGHASIYSGASPAIHGIIGNSWFDRQVGGELNCVGDSTVEGVGGRSSSPGKRSPRNMLVTTLGDQLRMATNFRSKVVSVALKDRAAILPGGHSATGVYWFDGSSGNWITSTYYRDSLPGWVANFNAQKLPSKYLQQGWKLLYPPQTYTASTSDDQPYEEGVIRKQAPVFPYELAGVAGNSYGFIGNTPLGNTLTREMAIAAIKGENLGKDSDTDLLAISFSPPDVVGHANGIHSVEQEDLYLRLDKELEALLNFVDNWVGKGQYTVFLSADHGAMEVPELRNKHKIPGGRVNMEEIYERIRKRITQEFGEGAYVTAAQNRQIYLNHELLKARKMDVDQIYSVVKDELTNVKEISDVYITDKLGEARLIAYQRELYLNEIHTKRSGDLLITIAPGWINKATYGTSHGSGSNYDTQVPFLLYGWGIQPGETLDRTRICDIAPTISALLNITAPEGSIGTVVSKALKSNRSLSEK
jgi:predicted AlkP superfamily pyrophosphatase or phosphodiesterase